MKNICRLCTHLKLIFYQTRKTIGQAQDILHQNKNFIGKSFFFFKKINFLYGQKLDLLDRGKLAKSHDLFQQFWILYPKYWRRPQLIFCPRVKYSCNLEAHSWQSHIDRQEYVWKEREKNREIGLSQTSISCTMLQKLWKCEVKANNSRMYLPLNFAWNQFWQNLNLKNCIFHNFRDLKNCSNLLKSNYWTYKMPKSHSFAFLDR